MVIITKSCSYILALPFTNYKIIFKGTKNLLALIEIKKNDKMRKDDFMIFSDSANFNLGYRATYHA